ncbi:GNAT family N-acetyltransferase [Arsenicicoccus dermatophilus]|uniref:GNAT family N-acetyltransferase n=1 Tax=Arsenicicoccus dermatophilus TaxID=1076331 RepID=UPI0039174E11
MRRNERDQPIGDDVWGWHPVVLPRGVRLVGHEVTLVDLTTDHVSDLFELTCGEGDEGLWTYMTAGPFRTTTELAAYLRKSMDNPTQIPLAIVGNETGRVVGTASWLRANVTDGVIEVGTILYSPEMQHHRGGTEAMYLMARHAIDELGYRRYEWKCDDLNTGSRAAAERYGFTYEGTFRKHMVYKGRNRDTAWYSMTDDEWRRLRPAYERWLADDNFDEHGRQRTRLSELTAAALGR